MNCSGLCDATIEASAQEELSGLLADAREGVLDAAGRARLDGLMADYRRGLVLKARAWNEAVARGHRAPPGRPQKPTPTMPRDHVPAEIVRAHWVRAGWHPPID